MEITKPRQMKYCLFVVIHLAILARIGFGNPYSVSSEGTNCNFNSLVETRPSSEKYISTLYFERHDSFIDDSFHVYIANELPISFFGAERDDLDIKLSVHKRLLIGEGSHRKLHSTIKLDIQPDLIAEKFNHLWKFVIVERLPRGVFADPFELQHLLDRGAFTDATVLGDTNLELPSIASNRSLVEIHVGINHGILSGLNNVLEIDIEFPLHVRYPVKLDKPSLFLNLKKSSLKLATHQAPNLIEASMLQLTKPLEYPPLEESGLTRIEFGRPDLFVLHNIEEKSDQSCLLAKESDVECQPVVWEVPCGIKEHSQIVSVVTFVSAVVSALFIVLTTLSNPRIGIC